MLEPVVRCFTPAVAKQIAELRADPPTQARIDELAVKCNEGELMEAERREYAAYVEAIDLIGLLQEGASHPRTPSSKLMDAAVRAFVRERAGNRCEYCLLGQEHLPFSTFLVEHIIPRKRGGDDDPATLALACDRCNSHKGTNLTGIDPETGEIVPLFNPRQHLWEAHFHLSDVTIVGLTAVGGTTVRVLGMNEERRVRLRAVLKRYGQL